MDDRRNAPEGRDHIQSIERGFAVLHAFDADRPRPTSTDLAEVTGLSRPAVRRILLTLQHLGYVQPVDGRWRLTPRVLSLGQHFTSTNSIVEVAEPHLARLSETTAESASLAVLDGTEAVYIARVSVRRIMNIDVSPGTRLPAAATSMGRVLLAWAEEPQIERVLSAGAPAYTDRTVTDPKALRGILRDVHSQGWSLVDGELDAELISISVPVRDHSGSVVAALVSSTSVARATPEEFRADVLEPLLATAARLSTDLGQPRGLAAREQREGFF
ncbi:IclR family transcriptional regulator C-terminal domain-containing protein [Pseudonocardia nantongensis]|uniref:IclR family transcriptional regulator domain-containing protein n=1 Tax=Pseudonocardia nantongensis TaxID=1181885 RepID=UPI00397E8B19